MSAVVKAAPKLRDEEILSHWPKLIEGLQHSPQGFYERLERALEERQIPDIRVFRVAWQQGGPISARRQYLRIKRERLIFDVCGAPFGTGFFVSWRFGEKTLKLGLLAICFIIGATVLWVRTNFYRFYFYDFMWEIFGATMDTSNFILAAIPSLAALFIVVRVGANLDAFLMRLPIISFFYERFLRANTFYRKDLMCMYEQAVQNAVMQVIDEITAEKGLPPLSDYDRRAVSVKTFLKGRKRPVLNDATALA